MVTEAISGIPQTENHVHVCRKPPHRQSRREHRSPNGNIRMSRLDTRFDAPVGHEIMIFRSASEPSTGSVNIESFGEILADVLQDREGQVRHRAGMDGGRTCGQHRGAGGMGAGFR
ncbi:hypothetical protein [Saccharopolyspora phatthalungensis]|uniref:Uncharacterized protein n=1 Tax=Saccharopolyspora phatthalungensis TaxID=664693 RepID=A0A840Q742_9PSEU|nr:hypothetical protein [Saccharopolyspora phatthalungensis]MBB5156484.1 hypothetical protein [Saccharopolyspora phatthalungensis]